jgi:hypothetical protein
MKETKVEVGLMDVRISRIFTGLVRIFFYLNLNFEHEKKIRINPVKIREIRTSINPNLKIIMGMDKVSNFRFGFSELGFIGF